MSCIDWCQVSLPEPIHRKGTYFSVCTLVFSISILGLVEPYSLEISGGLDYVLALSLLGCAVAMAWTLGIQDREDKKSTLIRSFELGIVVTGIWTAIAYEIYSSIGGGDAFSMPPSPFQDFLWFTLLTHFVLFYIASQWVWPHIQVWGSK